jgi:hypothetical protein
MPPISGRKPSGALSRSEAPTVKPSKAGGIPPGYLSTRPYKYDSHQSFRRVFS